MPNENDNDTPHETPARPTIPPPCPQEESGFPPVVIGLDIGSALAVGAVWVGWKVLEEFGGWFLFGMLGLFLIYCIIPGHGGPVPPTPQQAAQQRAELEEGERQRLYMSQRFGLGPFPPPGSPELIPPPGWRSGDPVRPYAPAPSAAPSGQYPGGPAAPPYAPPAPTYTPSAPTYAPTKGQIYLQFCRNLDAAGGPPRAQWVPLAPGSWMWDQSVPIAGGSVSIIMSTANGSTIATFTDSVGGRSTSTTAVRAGDFTHPAGAWRIDP